jgi:hypothetical protein
VRFNRSYQRFVRSYVRFIHSCVRFTRSYVRFNRSYQRFIRSYARFVHSCVRFTRSYGSFDGRLAACGRCGCTNRAGSKRLQNRFEVDLKYGFKFFVNNSDYFRYSILKDINFLGMNSLKN